MKLDYITRNADAARPRDAVRDDVKIAGVVAYVLAGVGALGFLVGLLCWDNDFVRGSHLATGLWLLGSVGWFAIWLFCACALRLLCHVAVSSSELLKLQTPGTVSLDAPGRFRISGVNPGGVEVTTLIEAGSAANARELAEKKGIRIGTIERQ